MEQIRLEKLIASLHKEKMTLDPKIKADVMAYVAVNGFARAKHRALRYAIGFAAFLLFGAGGTVFAAQLAQPGQALYSVKRASETAYVNIQPSNTAKVLAHQALIDRRIKEADRFVGDDSDVNTKWDDGIDEQMAIDIRLANDTADESDAWIDAQENIFSLAIERDR